MQCHFGFCEDELIFTMTKHEIEQKVREIIATKMAIPLETIGAESRLIEDLQVDSFGAVELMFELEEAFGLNIPDSDIERVRSVNQIVEYLSEWLKKKSENPVLDATREKSGILLPPVVGEPTMSPGITREIGS